MAEEENQREADEERMIRLSAPAVLDDEALKAVMTEDIASNRPEYMAEVAERHGLDLERDAAAVRDTVYEEQLGVIVETCIANALDENTIDSYALLQRACYFSPEDIAYMNAAEGENLSANIAKYIEERLSGVKVLTPVIRFTNAVNEAILYSTGDYPNFTSYKANQLKEKFDDSGLKLTDEERGKLHFIASRMYRKLGAQASPLSDNHAGVQEAECLRKVLMLSGDYKLISYCQNRLPEKKDEQNIVRAYKHALTKKQSRGDMYKINAELAGLYLIRAKAIGFMVKNSGKEIAAGKAVKYLLGAYRYADREDRLPVLKRIADIQMMQGNIEGWVSTKEVIAMKFLKGEERCLVLNSIGDKTGEIGFYRKALEECDKARMPSSSKIHVREVTYEKIALKATDETVRKEAEQQLAEVRRQKQQAYRQLLNGGKGKI